MGSAGFSSKEVRKSGRLGRSQAFVWSPWDENPFPLASWGLLDTLFPRWASLCSSLQWHFHKTLSLWFQAGLCVADRTLIDFQRFLLLLLLFFSRILVLRIPGIHIHIVYYNILKSSQKEDYIIWQSGGRHC